MKKTVILLIFISFLSNITAQTSKFEIGPEIGLNISSYNFSDTSSDDSSIKRIAFGIVGKFNFSNNWSIKTKIKYEGKGSRIIDRFDRVFHIQKLNYLNLPLMAEWKFGNGNLRGFLNLGIFGGVLLSATEEYRDDGEIDNSNSFNSTDFGAAYGLGAIYKLKKNINLFFELGGQYGNIDVDSRGVAPWKLTEMFSGNLGISFGL
jgi:opacity protein-like surface antigen